MDMDVPHELDTQLGKGWEDTILSLYKEGAGDPEVASALRITMAMFDRFYQGYAIFEEYVNKGRSDARAWYERVGRNGLIKSNGDLNHQLWFLIMKNRYGWKDKMDEDDHNKTPAGMLSSDELDRKIAAKFKEVKAIAASGKAD